MSSPKSGNHGKARVLVNAHNEELLDLQSSLKIFPVLNEKIEKYAQFSNNMDKYCSWVVAKSTLKENSESSQCWN